jgi:hypothetical protein
MNRDTACVAEEKVTSWPNHGRGQVWLPKPVVCFPLSARLVSASAFRIGSQHRAFAASPPSRINRKYSDGDA